MIFVNSNQNLHLVQFSYWSPIPLGTERGNYLEGGALTHSGLLQMKKPICLNLLSFFAFLSIVIQPILTRSCFELPASQITPSPLFPTCQDSRKWLVYSMASCVSPPTLHLPPCHPGRSVPLAWEAQPQAFWVEWTWEWYPTQSCVTKKWPLQGPPPWHPWERVRLSLPNVVNFC